jgi:hypothetical protein
MAWYMLHSVTSIVTLRMIVFSVCSLKWTLFSGYSCCILKGRCGNAVWVWWIHSLSQVWQQRCCEIYFAALNNWTSSGERKTEFFDENVTQVYHVLILRRLLRQFVNKKMVSLYTYFKGTGCCEARNTKMVSLYTYLKGTGCCEARNTKMVSLYTYLKGTGCCEARSTKMVSLYTYLKGTGCCEARNTKMVSLYTYLKGTGRCEARITRPHTILKFIFSMLMFNEVHEKLLQSVQYSG